MTGAASLREEVTGFARQQGDEVIACVMPALRAAGTLPADARRAGGFDDLAADCAARLRARLARPARADDDWSIEPPGGCACELCGTLGEFLQDPARRTFEWPLAQERRRHIHSRIDTAELPVRHETRRKGRPYTLFLARTRRSSSVSDRHGSGTNRTWTGSTASGNSPSEPTASAVPGIGSAG
jgi:hypothetical protein